jgi:hypothetical protein
MLSVLNIEDEILKELLEKSYWPLVLGPWLLAFGSLNILKDDSKPASCVVRALRGI